jgi:hypothetical protein
MMFKNTPAIFASSNKRIHDNSSAQANSNAVGKFSTRSLLQGVSLLALFSVGIATPQAAWAADGGYGGTPWRPSRH